MSSRRAVVEAVLGIAVGAGLLLLSAAETWSRATVTSPGNGASLPLSVTGKDVAPALPALGYALLALAGAVIASRGVLRRVVGALVVFVGAAALGVAVTARGDVSGALEDKELGVRGVAVHAGANGWWVPALLGGLVAVVVGAVVVARSRNWARMGAKYDAPTAPSPATAEPKPVDPDAQAWAALDRGEDPTA
ncbi:MAG TPA: Trp biosynthesis-associated membrane protein [Mycobacteriales bacterium]|nr:Trp biosynthesis-associated membrane protein [Mycobacteriales bacterium]